MHIPKGADKGYSGKGQSRHARVFRNLKCSVGFEPMFALYNSRVFPTGVEEEGSETCLCLKESILAILC